jgi:hypothetical protein
LRPICILIARRSKQHGRVACDLAQHLAARAFDDAEIRASAVKRDIPDCRPGPPLNQVKGRGFLHISGDKIASLIDVYPIVFKRIEQKPPFFGLNCERTLSLIRRKIVTGACAT